MKNRNAAIAAVILICLIWNLRPSSGIALAAGKKPTPPENQAPITTPIPVRPVVLKTVSTLPFQLPNGSHVDLSSDLGLILQSAVTSTPAFAVTDETQPEPCNSRIEIRSGISTLELNIAELGLTFGYSPSGATSTISNLTGKYTVKVGLIAMDFSVWQCTSSGCMSVAASTSSQNIVGQNLTVDVDFSQVHGSANLVFNTALGDLIRKIMNDGLQKIATSPRINELSWRATVREVSPEKGTLIFDAGSQLRLAPQQSFVVYAVTPSTGICSVYKPVAYLRSSMVDVVSTQAVIEQVLDSRGVKAGDLVMIKIVK